MRPIQDVQLTKTEATRQAGARRVQREECIECSFGVVAPRTGRPRRTGFLTRGSARYAGLPSRRRSGDGAELRRTSDCSLRALACRSPLTVARPRGIYTHFAWPPGRASDFAESVSSVASPCNFA